MSYGIQIFNADGTLKLDMSTGLARLLDARIVSAASGYYDIAGISAFSPVALATVIGATYSAWRMAHLVSISGDRVTYSSPSYPWPTGPTYIMVVGYAC